LHLALAALGIGPGDEVITTPLTFCATVNTILQVGATPVLADVGADGNIDPQSVADRIGPRTKAIVPVHIAGLPCDMNAIWSLAKRHDLRVIEDAAHAVGAQYRGQMIGAGDPVTTGRSDAVAFSFYATKNLTTGEGGMVTTHDDALLERMRVLCLHGISKDAWTRYTGQGNWYYEVTEGGFKYNLSDIQSAIGIHQLRKQEEFVRIRSRYAEEYNRAFGKLPEVEIPQSRSDVRMCWHLYILKLRLEKLRINRAEFIAALKERGIAASVHFIPLPLHPYYQGLPGMHRDLCPRALEIYPRIVSLPLYPAMTQEQVKYVVESVTDILRAAKKAGPAIAVPPGKEALVESRCERAE
jgi:dTDP-4-amino-4,6-dideoxygalactose transaminase